MRILVVSDVRIVQEGLHWVLAQQNGVDIISTVDMRHATHRSAQLHPDIVLFDAEILTLAAAGTAGCARDSAASGDVVAVLKQVLC